MLTVNAASSPSLCACVLCLLCLAVLCVCPPQSQRQVRRQHKDRRRKMDALVEAAKVRHTTILPTTRRVSPLLTVAMCRLVCWRRHK